MPDIHYNNQSLRLIEGESILDCLLRHEIDYPHSCCIGVCQACLIKAEKKVVDAKWQEGLPDTLKSQGYFLACRATPSGSMELKSTNASECDQPAEIAEIHQLTHNVLQVKLLTDNLENWIPGQYLSFVNPKGVSRSYSIANLPATEGYIELHIKLKNKGMMSLWMQEMASVGTIIHIRGPFGKCYYLNPCQSSFDIILAGTGTGLAPLLAITKSALSLKHQGNITLIHGGCHDEDIYYAEELKTLASLNQNFEYVPCVLKSKGRYSEANIFDKTLEHLTNHKDLQVYVCGPEETTRKLKTKVFLAGIPSEKIYSDAFL